jgi:hypothetical protein
MYEDPRVARSVCRANSVCRTKNSVCRVNSVCRTKNSVHTELGKVANSDATHPFFAFLHRKLTKLLSGAIDEHMPFQ